MGRPEDHVARRLGRVHRDALDLFERHPAIDSAGAEDLDHGGEALVGVVESLERLAIKRTRQRGDSRVGLIEPLAGLGVLAASQVGECFESLSHVFGRGSQDLRLLGPGEDGAAAGLGIEGRAILFHRRGMAGVVVAEDVELLAGAIEIAREEEELEEEEPRRPIGRRRLDLGNLLVDRLLEPAALEQIAGGHGSLLKSSTSGRVEPGRSRGSGITASCLP